MAHSIAVAVVSVPPANCSTGPCVHIRDAGAVRHCSQEVQIAQQAGGPVATAAAAFSGRCGATWEQPH